MKEMVKYHLPGKCRRSGVLGKCHVVSLGDHSTSLHGIGVFLDELVSSAGV